MDRDRPRSAPILIGMELNALRVPLYHLYYIDVLSSFTGLKDEEIKSFKSQYEDSVLKEILVSLKWAVNNPNYDFNSLLPDLMKSNEEIYEYLCKIDRSLDDLRVGIVG